MEYDWYKPGQLLEPPKLYLDWFQLSENYWSDAATKFSFSC